MHGSSGWSRLWDKCLRRAILAVIAIISAGLSSICRRGDGKGSRAAPWAGPGCAAARKIRAFCPDAAWRRAVAPYAPQSRNGRRAKLWSPLLGWAICSIPTAGWFRDFHRSGGDKGP